MFTLACVAIGDLKAAMTLNPNENEVNDRGKCLLRGFSFHYGKSKMAIEDAVNHEQSIDFEVFSSIFEVLISRVMLSFQLDH